MGLGGHVSGSGLTVLAEFLGEKLRLWKLGSTSLKMESTSAPKLNMWGEPIPPIVDPVLPSYPPTSASCADVVSQTVDVAHNLYRLWTFTLNDHYADISIKTLESLVTRVLQKGHRPTWYIMSFERGDLNGRLHCHVITQYGLVDPISGAKRATYKSRWVGDYRKAYKTYGHVDSKILRSVADVCKAVSYLHKPDSHLLYSSQTSLEFSELVRSYKC